MICACGMGSVVVVICDGFEGLVHRFTRNAGMWFAVAALLGLMAS